MTKGKNTYAQDNQVRLQRMQLWLDRADAADKDSNLKSKDKGAVRFIFYWIAFEAAFETQNRNLNRKNLMKRFIKTVVNKDEPRFNKLLNCEEVYQDSVKLLKLRATHEGFWQQLPDAKTHEAWKQLFDKEIKEFPCRDSLGRLCVIFNRLRVVRRQIFHGASSIDMSRGKPQVEVSLRILSIVIPAFKRVMEANKDNDWKSVPYPRVSKNAPPIWEEKRE